MSFGEDAYPDLGCKAAALLPSIVNSHPSAGRKQATRMAGELCPQE